MVKLVRRETPPIELSLIVYTTSEFPKNQIVTIIIV
jgi:hypothetical protein